MSLMKPLFNFCKTRYPATREGHVASSFIQVPVLGFWSPSGKQLTFPASSLKQPTDVTLTGRSMPNTYKTKSPCS
jgi:hypothetical protein